MPNRISTEAFFNQKADIFSEQVVMTYNHYLQLKKTYSGFISHCPP